MSKAKAYKPTKESNKHTSEAPIKGILLYVFLVPLFISVLLALLQTNIKLFIFNSIAFGLFFLTLKISRIGFLQEHEYKSSVLTKAPKVPYKTIAGFLLGGSTLFTAWLAGGEPFITSAFLATIATLGYYLYYGFDPKEDKLDNIGDVSADFVLETINEAKSKLHIIENDMEKIKDISLHNKFKVAVNKAKDILEIIQNDPKDIRVARKFLIVYIDGVLKVTQSYVSMDAGDVTEQSKENLHTLMEDLNHRFDKELERLRQNNQFDLDVHIDVLKQQINH